MSRRVTRNSAKGKSVMPRKSLFEGEDSSASDADGGDPSFDDSMALLARSILALTKQTRKTPKTRKKRTPKRRSRAQPQRQWLPPGFPCMLSCNCAAHPDNAGPSQSPATTSTETTKKERKKRASKKQPTTSMDIDLLSDEEDVTLKDSQVTGLQSRVNNFFKVIESSDEEMEMLSKTINPAPAEKKEKNFYVIPSDSDNEDAAPSAPLTNHEESVILVSDNLQVEPSTRTNWVPDSIKSTASTSKSNSSQKEDLFVVVDDIIDNYGGGSSESPRDAPVKSLEELKKKTEEILGSVSSLIEDMNKKSNKPEEKVAEPTIKPACPICLDEFGPNGKPWVTFCGHMFCEPCIKAVCKSAKKCPTCRKKVLLKEVHPVYL